MRNSVGESALGSSPFIQGRFALGREDQEPRPLTNKRKRDAWKEGKRKSVSHRIFPPLTRLKNICS